MSLLTVLSSPLFSFPTRCLTHCPCLVSPADGEETEDGAIIWIHDLTTGERFNLSTALSARLGLGGQGR